MKVTVNVTAADIAAAGEVEHAVTTATCPIARAVRREYPKAVVGRNTVWFDGLPDLAQPKLTKGRNAKEPSKPVRRGKLPPEATRFVDAFDHERKVKPFSFEVTLRTYTDNKED